METLPQNSLYDKIRVIAWAKILNATNMLVSWWKKQMRRFELMSNCAILISTHCFWPLGFSALVPTATNRTHIPHINEQFRHVLLMAALDRKLA